MSLSEFNAAMDSLDYLFWHEMIPFNEYNERREALEKKYQSFLDQQ